MNIFQWSCIQNQQVFIQEKKNWKCHLQNVGHFVSASMCKVIDYQVADSLSKTDDVHSERCII